LNYLQLEHGLHTERCYFCIRQCGSSLSGLYVKPIPTNERGKKEIGLTAYGN